MRECEAGREPGDKTGSASRLMGRIERGRIMRNWKRMLCLLLLLIPSLGRGEVRVQLREQDLPGVHLAFFAAEGEDNEAGEVEAINLMLDAFFRQQEAVRMAPASARRRCCGKGTGLCPWDLCGPGTCRMANGGAGRRASRMIFAKGPP